MKIIYHHRIRSKDGQSVHLEELITALRELGHSVYLVGPGAFASSEFGSEPSVLTRAKRYVPAILYEIMELGYNLPAFVRLFMQYRKVNPDLIYERYNLYSLAGVLLHKFTKVPLLLEVNAPLALERAKYGGLGLPQVARALENWTWRGASFVLPVSEVLSELIQRESVPANRIEVVPNAINIAAFARAPTADDSKGKLGFTGKTVVGFVGFVRHWHGLDAVVDLLAGANVPEELCVLIVGDGPAIKDLKAQAQRLNVSHRIMFAGLVEHDEVPALVSAFDIALLPSCVDYCSPLKLFEYMAMGKAIAAPDQANIREVISHGKSGFLFSPDNSGAMANAVLSLAKDQSARALLGDAARSLILSRGYTWHQNAERVLAIARNLGARLR